MATSENQNDLIAYVNKNYRLGILYSKELVETIASEHASQE